MIQAIPCIQNLPGFHYQVANVLGVQHRRQLLSAVLFILLSIVCLAVDYFGEVLFSLPTSVVKMNNSIFYLVKGTCWRTVPLSVQCICHWRTVHHIVMSH